MPGTKKRQKPLLYVYQPKLATPVLNMQSTYFIKPDPGKKGHKGMAVNEMDKETFTELIDSTVDPIETGSTSVEEGKTLENATGAALPIDERAINAHGTAEKSISQVSDDEGHISTGKETSVSDLEYSIPVNEDPLPITTKKEELSPAGPPPETEEYRKNPFSRNRIRGGSLRRIKHFKEMSIDEKLAYIIHFPKQLPPIAFTYITGNIAFSGVFLNHTEDQIEIQQLDGSIKTIRIADITRIKMVV